MQAKLRGQALLIGLLPRFFVMTALLNFCVGVGLGIAMAVNVSAWSALGPIHAVLNPIGWLTMLIYGMTYAVLGLMAGLKLPWPQFAWIQLAAAELGVIIDAVALPMHQNAMRLWGTGLQAFAACLFLFNILSGVISSRIRKKNMKNADTEPVPSLHSAGELQTFIGKPLHAKPTDKIGQQGTELALMVYIATILWTLIEMLQTNIPEMSRTALNLTYYGWIAGTVLAVSLHLYPRYTGVQVAKYQVLRIGQVLWMIGVLLTFVSGLGIPRAGDTGVRLVGISIALYAAMWLLNMYNGFSSYRGPVRMAWFFGWVFALGLGVSLLAGANPLGLSTLHTLFLGWITTTAYGIGYTFFPSIFQKLSPRASFGQIQLGLSVMGTALMILSFSTWGVQMGVASVGLAFGGSLAGAAFVMFAGYWLLAARRP